MPTWSWNLRNRLIISYYLTTVKVLYLSVSIRTGHGPFSSGCCICILHCVAYFKRRSDLNPLSLVHYCIDVSIRGDTEYAISQSLLRWSWTGTDSRYRLKWACNLDFSFRSVGSIYVDKELNKHSHAHLVLSIIFSLIWGQIASTIRHSVLSGCSQFTLAESMKETSIRQLDLGTATVSCT